MRPSREMRDEREILVSVGYDGGTAGVYRDGDDVLLTGGLERTGGGGTVVSTYVGSRWALEGLAHGRFVVGGLLPEGATRAIAIAVRGEEVPGACANGAWVAVIDGGVVPYGVPVRFEDDTGAIVRPTLPPKWTREPVPDADVPCPACGGKTWERVTPTDDSRGTRSTGKRWPRFEPTPVLACERCGHEESERTWTTLEYEEEDDESDVEARVAEWRRAQAREHADVLARADFPLYALEASDLPVALGGWGGDEGGVESVELRHGDGARCVSVETERPGEYGFPRDFLDAARRALFVALHDEVEWPDASPPAVALWLDVRHRERDAVATTAPAFTADITVDGAPVAFQGARAGEAWAAAAEIGAVRVVITAHGFEPTELRLRELDDPAAALAVPD